jgi:hypothetical protein
MTRNKIYFVNIINSKNGEIVMAQEKTGFIVKFFDKAYEEKSIIELAEAPVAAISGVSDADAADLKKAFDINTVEDLAGNDYVLLSQAVVLFSDASGEILDKKFDAEEFKALADKPAHAINGISESDAALLKKAFGIDTIRELADNKYVLIAQSTVALADLVAYIIEMEGF